jgi:hypothetical protein
LAMTGRPSELPRNVLRHEIIRLAARPGFSAWPWPRPWLQLRDPTYPIVQLIAADSETRLSVLTEGAARDIVPTARIGPLTRAAISREVPRQ